MSHLILPEHEDLKMQMARLAREGFETIFDLRLNTHQVGVRILCPRTNELFYLFDIFK